MANIHPFFNLETVILYLLIQYKKKKSCFLLVLKRIRSFAFFEEGISDSEDTQEKSIND